MNTSISGLLARVLEGAWFGRSLLALVASGTLSWSALGATWAVTNLSDTGPGSLREEIATARSEDTIIIQASGTIFLTNGELLISKGLAIRGPGSGNLAISGSTNSRVFSIAQGAKVSLFGFSVCDGRAENGTAGSSNSPAGGEGNDGGGIYNGGTLTLTQCIISNCAAGVGGPGYIDNYGASTPGATNWFGGRGGRGGAIYNGGQLLLMSSRLTSNSSGRGGRAGGVGEYIADGSSGGGGGAIYNAGTMIVISCALEHNTAGIGGVSFTPSQGTFNEKGGTGGDGGAICDAGQTRTFIADSQFSDNNAGSGQGTSQLTMAGPVVGGSGGTGGRGGAVWAMAPIQMNGCTFVSNQAGSGGAGSWGGRGGSGGVGGAGGAIYAIGELGLTHCLCVSNHAGWGGDGGGAYPGGAGSGVNGGSGGVIYAESSLRLADCIFSGNSAGRGGQGASSFSPGGGGTGGSGGAVYCLADLAATRCTLSGNQAGDGGEPGSAIFNPSNAGQGSSDGANGGEGGGIFAIGPMVLHACTVSGNSGGSATSADAGKMYLDALGQQSPEPTFIYYTRIGGTGGAGGTGGIHAENSLRMSLCTLSGNVGGPGGSGGQSGDGFMGDDGPLGGAGGKGGPGAVWCALSNELVLVACTIAFNKGGPGGAGGGGETRHNGQSGDGPGGSGGVGGVVIASPAVSARVINTLIASNSGGPGGGGGNPGDTGAADVQGSFSSFGHNLIGSADGSSGFENSVEGDIVGSDGSAVDPLLAPLALNGSPHGTLALLHGSPAIDSGTDALLAAPYGFETDQRGFPRRSGAHVDIGAFEAQFGAFGPLLTSTGISELRGFSLTGTNYTAATFSILCASNLQVPAKNWQLLGALIETAPGEFLFNDAQATNFPQRFYRVSSP